MLRELITCRLIDLTVLGELITCRLINLTVFMAVLYELINRLLDLTALGELITCQLIELFFSTVSVSVIVQTRNSIIQVSMSE